MSVCLHLTFSEYTKGGGKDDMEDSKEEVIQRTVFMATIMRLLTTEVMTLLTQGHHGQWGWDIWDIDTTFTIYGGG